MFDISTVSKRYFGIRLVATDDDGKEHSIQLEVEPPKLKMLKRLISVIKRANVLEDATDGNTPPDNDSNMDEIDANEDLLNEMTDIVQKLLSKNKARMKVSVDYIDALDFDDISTILQAYFGWVCDTRKSDPN